MTNEEKLELEHARIARHSALDVYDTEGNALDTPQYREMSLIMNELTECMSGLSEDENVVSLQLSNVIDTYVRTLPNQDCSIFLKRYFYLDSITDIADYFGISKEKVQKILKRCLHELNKFFNKEGYIFKVETLFTSFTDISNDLLIISDNTIRHNKQVQSKNKRFKLIAIAVSIVLIVTIGIITSIIISSNSIDEKITNYVDTSTLLTNVDELGTTLSSIHYTQKYALTYSQLVLKDNNVLKDCIGSLVEEISPSSNISSGYTWYRLKGHDDMQYLIRKDANTLTLWKYFFAINTYGTEYPYGDILSLVYNINGPEDIEELNLQDTIVRIENDVELPPEEPNKIIKEDTIAYVYYTLADMTCYGPDTLELARPDSDYITSMPIGYNLSIKTTKGENFDTLSFSNACGCFMEGDAKVAYEKLSSATIFALGKLVTQDHVDAYKTDNWMTHMSVKNVTSTGLTLVLTQYGGNFDGQLYTGPAYQIESWSDGSIFYLDQYTILNAEYYITSNTTTEIYLTWEDIYGELPPGKYTIYKNVSGISDVNGGNYTFSADFEITK